VRRGDLDPVEPGLGRERRAARVGGDDLLHLRRAQRPRLGVVAMPGQRRRRHHDRPRRRGDHLAATVEQLHEQLRPLAPDRGADAPVPVDHAVEVAADRVWREQPRGRGRDRLHHDQPRAAARPRALVGDEVVRRQVFVDERRLVRGRDDPARQLGRADRQRAEQVVEHRCAIITQYVDFEELIAGRPAGVQDTARRLLAIARELVPDAVESCDGEDYGVGFGPGYKGLVFRDHAAGRQGAAGDRARRGARRSGGADAGSRGGAPARAGR
jgi:hypothetical protein